MLDKKTLIMMVSFVFFIVTGLIVWFLIVPKDDEEPSKKTEKSSPAPPAPSAPSAPSANARNTARAGRNLVKIRI